MESATAPDASRKAFHARGWTAVHLDFRHKLYRDRRRAPREGIRLYPKNGGTVENWPDQNRANGTTKNTNTSRRYKQMVRAMKRLENDMVDKGRLNKEVHGYFIECLLYNIKNSTFRGGSYTQTAKDILAELWHAIEDGEADDWAEVNYLKWLWRSGQTWTPEEAANFAHKAWNYIDKG